MIGLFLQTATLGNAGMSSIIGLVLGFLAVMAVVSFALYIYMALAFMAIGKKAKDPLYGLAWIPGLGASLIAFRASKMHWWPWLLLASMLIVWIPVIGSIVYFLAMMTFAVYNIIWLWKMFEAIDKPGWWAILLLIPIVNFIIMGIAAWSKN